MDSRPVDVHPDDGFALAEDLAFETQVASAGTDQEGSPSRPLGVAFLLGMVAGVTASALLRSSRTLDQPPTRPRRVFVRRRRAPEGADSFSAAVQEEAAQVARAVVKDLGRAASRWLLEGVASRSTESASGSTEEAESGP